MVLLVIESWHMNFATSWQMIVASTLDFHDPLPAHCNIWLGVCCVCATFAGMRNVRWWNTSSYRKWEHVMLAQPANICT